MDQSIVVGKVVGSKGVLLTYRPRVRTQVDSRLRLALKHLIVVWFLALTTGPRKVALCQQRLTYLALR